MKKYNIVLSLLCFGFVLFAQTQTRITKTILPLVNTLPVVFQDNVTGGFHQVADDVERDALPVALKEKGMLLFTQDNNKCYQWTGIAWQQVMLLKSWTTDAVFAIGDKFLYNNTIVTAIAAGTIGASDNPLTLPLVWSTSSSIKAWPTTGTVAFVAADMFSYNNTLVIANASGSIIGGTDTPLTTLAAKFNSNAVLKPWTTDAVFAIGDKFLYNNTIVTAIAAGTIGASDNPLTLPLKWSSTAAIKAWPTSGFPVSFAAGDMFSYNNMLVIANASGSIAAVTDLPLTTLAAKFNSNAVLKPWTTDAVFAIGDKFLYNNTIVTAIAAGTIGASDNPLTLPLVWSTSSSIKAWPTTGTVAFVAGDMFSYNNTLVIANASGSIIGGTDTPLTTLAAKFNSNAVLKPWTTDAVFAIGDKFLYNNTIVTAIAAGTIGASDNPLTLPLVWSTSSSIKAWPTTGTVAFVAGDMFSYNNTLVIANASGSIIGGTDTPLTTLAAKFNSNAVLKPWTTDAVFAIGDKFLYNNTIVTAIAAGTIGASDNPLVLPLKWSSTAAIKAWPTSGFPVSFAAGDMFSYNNLLVIANASGSIAAVTDLPLTTLAAKFNSNAVLKPWTTDAVFAIGDKFLYNNTIVTAIAAGTIGASDNPLVLPLVWSTSSSIKAWPTTGTVAFAIGDMFSYNNTLVIANASGSIIGGTDTPLTTLAAKFNSNAVLKPWTTDAVFAIGDKFLYNNTIVTAIAAGTIGASDNPLVLPLKWSSTAAIKAWPTSGFPVSFAAGDMFSYNNLLVIANASGSIAAVTDLPLTTLAAKFNSNAVLKPWTTDAVFAIGDKFLYNNTIVTAIAAGTIGASDNPLVLPLKWSSTAAIKAWPTSGFPVSFAAGDMFSYNNLLVIANASGSIAAVTDLPLTTLAAKFNSNAVLKPWTTDAVFAIGDKFLYNNTIVTAIAAGTIGASDNPLVLPLVWSTSSSIKAWPTTGTVAFAIGDMFSYNNTLVIANASGSIIGGTDTPLTTLAAKFNSNAVLKPWTTDAVFAIGDKFLYNNTIVTAIAAGTIGASDNPLVLPLKWSSTAAIKAWPTSGFPVSFAAGDMFSYNNLLVIANASGSIAAVTDLPLTTLAAKFNSNAVLKPWTTDAVFAIGDKFLYNNTIVTAVAAGTIGASDNPLAMPTVWSSGLSVKLWATGAMAAIGDRFLYQNNVVTALAASTIAADETPDTNPANWNYDIHPTSKTINIGTGVAAAAQTITLGAASGNFAHAVNIATGASTTANTVTIGGAKTNGSLFATTTGTVNLGDVSPTVSIATGNAAAAQTIAIGTGNTTGTQAINIGTGNATAAQTINLGTGVAAAVQTINIGASGGNQANVINIGNGTNTTANTILIGSGTTTTTINGTTSYPSDERLKDNIQTLTGVLAKLDQMRGVSYVFKDQVKYARGPQIGVLAQELQKVFPELVVTDAKGGLSVNYTQLTAVVLQAVKEQQVEINLLKKQMAEVMQKLGLK